ncbi:MAG: DUF4296 domain-containing protein [Bacteroidales bacterium]|nr:DUF4296 domain-containing protein [Bacteroidales bacterium]
MKRYSGHILALAIFVLALLPSCRKGEAELIPRSDLSRIYAEMLLTDQWIIHTPNVRNIADTSLVYEPILERYGYDSDDYRKSVDVYMDDPERFARIFRETAEILTERMDELKEEKERLEHLEMLRKKAEQYRPHVNWELTDPHKGDTTAVSLPDSLAIAMDSTSGIYRISYVPLKDTVYHGVRMILHESDTLKTERPDTSEVSPKVEIIDTLMPGSARRLKLVKPDNIMLNNGRK